MIRNILSYFTKENTNSSKYKPPAFRGVHVMHSHFNTIEVEHIYENNIIVNRCISLIAQNIANIPILIFENDVLQNSHSVAKLLECPNKRNTIQDLMTSITTYLMLYGVAYIHVLCDLTGKPSEIYALHPAKLKAVTYKNDEAVEYDYYINNTVQRIKVQSDNFIITISTFSLENHYLSPTKSVLHAANLYNSITEHNQAVLFHGCRLSGALVVNQNLTEEQRQMLKESLSSDYSGSKRAGKVAVFEGDMEWKNFHISTKDIDFSEGKIMAAREISAMYGVPLSLIGMIDSSYSQVKHDRLHFWEDTLLPIANQILKHLQLSLVNPFWNCKLKFDLQSISVFAKGDENHYLSNFRDCFTINEIRAALGYKELSNDELNLLHKSSKNINDKKTQSQKGST